MYKYFGNQLYKFTKHTSADVEIFTSLLCRFHKLITKKKTQLFFPLEGSQTFLFDDLPEK